MRCLLLTALLVVAPPTLAQRDHVDLVDFPASEANWDRFYTLEGGLMHAFDGLCGDTYCEGDYSNYRVMQFRCAVALASGTVQRCVWVIAASELGIDPEGGEVLVDNGRWVCEVDLQPGVPVEAFHAALDGPDGLYATLPGTTTGLFDVLPQCLRGAGTAGRNR